MRALPKQFRFGPRPDMRASALTVVCDSSWQSCPWHAQLEELEWTCMPSRGEEAKAHCQIGEEATHGLSLCPA